MAELKRVLGFWTILALSIGSIMGSGMFFGTAIGARHSGNASLISWALLTVIGIYIAMCFGELVSMFPRAGGVYEYSKRTYGRFFSFLMGWNAWIIGNLTIVLLIVAGINYLIPDPAQKALKIFISIAFIFFLNFIAYFGIEATSIILVVFAFFSITIILSFILPGLLHINMGNFSPFFSFGFSSITLTIFYLAESFFGWESATYLAEETKEPEKVIPKALIIGTLIVGILVILTSFVTLGIIPWRNLIEAQAPLALIFDKIFGSIGQLFNIGVFMILVGSAASSIISLPRLILALARDKLFIAQFADIHKKYNSPYKAIIFQTLISFMMFGMAFGKYNTLLGLLLPLGMLMYIFVILAVFILRFKEPHIERKYKVPFGKIGTLLAAGILAALMVIWFMYEPEAYYLTKIAGSFLLTGIPIYFMLVMYYDPGAIIKVNDFLAYLTYITERIILPRSLREEIITLLGDIKNRTVLEFGCSVGTLTMRLAEKVRPGGYIFATDLSKNELRITRKRLAEKGHTHVSVIHDEHQINRVHPHVPKVDAIVSLGMMGYLQDVKKVLREMNELLPEHGRIVFVDYVDFFKFIPNVIWLSDAEKIMAIFRECGFSVHVLKKKGILWNYLFVYGIKSKEDVPYI